jgi:hypothetical protein
MILGAEREGAAEEIDSGEVSSFASAMVQLTEIVSPFTDFCLAGLPRKDMVVRYFAETKGVVGCHYGPSLAVKVRYLKRFLNRISRVLL